MSLPPESATWRLFVALEIPAEARRTIEDLVSAGRARFPATVRWTPAGNVHLTLKFLGNCPVSRVDGVTAALSPAMAGHLPVHLRLERPGVFPGWRAPRVIWAGLDGDLDRLGRLQQSVETALASIGFPAERRPFRPHLTIGRVRDTAGAEERGRIGDWVRSLPALSAPIFVADHVVLMRSHLAPTGSSYEVVAQWTVE